MGGQRSAALEAFDLGIGPASVGAPACPWHPPYTPQPERARLYPVLTGARCGRCYQLRHAHHVCADQIPGWRPVPLYAVQSAHIAAMLRHTGGDLDRAAALLGLSRDKLREKMDRYGILANPPPLHP